jgi:K+-transporting ATPase ATPase A chain
MNPSAIQAGLFVIVVAFLVKPVGAYLERVFERRHTFLDPLLLPAERLIYRLVGIDPKCEMDWKRYSLAFGVFGIVNVIVLYFTTALAGVVPVVFFEGNDHADDTGSRRQHCG